MAVRAWITGILLLAVAYFLTIWFPFWEYYSVSTSDDVSSEQLSVLQHKPSAEALSALFLDDAITVSLDTYDVRVSVNSTRSMIDHGIVLPGMAHPIHVVPFNPVSLDVSNSSWQLAAHSLTVAKHLLDLYEREKD
ncbi:MAG: hypothetical protein MI864_10545, partial [Pseudomonadales bacterium]|nr:hypothetical protein [Pseudomonadales bacterium]